MFIEKPRNHTATGEKQCRFQHILPLADTPSVSPNRRINCDVRRHHTSRYLRFHASLRNNEHEYTQKHQHTGTAKTACFRHQTIKREFIINDWSTRCSLIAAHGMQPVNQAT